MSWSPKNAGFESGSSGNTSYGKCRTSRHGLLPDFWQYRLGILAELLEEGIDYREEADGSIVANLPGRGWMKKTHEMQEQDYRDYIAKLKGVAQNV